MSLKALAFFHALVAGFIGLGFVGALIQGFAAIGLSISLLFVGFVGIVIVFCILSLSGSLQLQQNYRFCIAVAACECIIFPLGTILGLMTIRKLLNPEVIRQFISPSGPVDKNRG
jgi:hypothetical protein